MDHEPRPRCPITEYEQFVRAFNPVQFDAEQWVRTAKDAGMKYIIITSKHHDGFALFDSKVSNYDMVDARRIRRDALKALADASQRQGMKFGVYYSIMDWHHPDAQAPNTPELQLEQVEEPELQALRRDVHEAAAQGAAHAVPEHRRALVRW